MKWSRKTEEVRWAGYVTGVKNELIEFAEDMRLGVVRSRGEDTVCEC